MKGFVRNQIRTKPATNRRQSKKEKEKKGNDIAIMASSVGATENFKKGVDQTVNLVSGIRMVNGGFRLG